VRGPPADLDELGGDPAFASQSGGCGVVLLEPFFEALLCLLAALVGRLPHGVVDRGSFTLLARAMRTSAPYPP
jgi:hypothetical protein